MTTVVAEQRDGARPARRGWRRDRLRRSAAYAGVVGLGLLLLVLLALSAQRATQPLDPEGAGPEGAMALAEVLRDSGVEVEVVRSIGAVEAGEPDAATTVLVADPSNLGPGAAERLQRTSRAVGRLVLVGVDSDQLSRLGMPVEAFAGGGDELVARCASTVARDSDVVSAWDTRYLVQEGGTAATPCFVLPEPDSTTNEPAPGGGYGAAMVELDATARHPETVIVGFGPAWSNELVTDDSHAGTAVRALGSTPRLIWYVPGPGDLTAAGPGQDLDRGSVWPPWTAPAAALLGVAVVLLALVRGRRLGRLVREPLPVVVRAIETTESRGRLYRRAGDRDRAAAVLRQASAARLARRLAVPPGSGPAGIARAVSVATGLPASEVGDILSGPPPPDDTSLIQLAQQLTDLEERVRRP